MSVTTPVERFGVHRHNNVVLVSGIGECIVVVVCHQAIDGTLREIFSRFNRPLHELAHAPVVIDIFKKEHKHHLLPEDRATLFLRLNGVEQFDVVGLELEDDTGLVEECTFPLDGDFVWRAEHGHHIVIPAHLFPEEA